jgi:glycosyltransferase 2 family protein
VTVSLVEDGRRKAAADTKADARPWRRWAAWLAIACGIGLSAYLLYAALSGYSFDEIKASVLATKPQRLAMALLFMAASYACLTLNDFLALSYVKRPLPYPQVALASFISLSLGHSIGFAGLSSGAIRYRFYLRWGLTAEHVTKLVLFCGTTVALGLGALGGIALLLRPDIAYAIGGLGEGAALALGLACVVACLGYVALAAFVRGTLKIWKWTFELPSVRLALGQIAVGTVNFTFVASCLYQALASAADVDFLQVVSAYVLANVATLVTPVPGGLGVIESVVTYAVPGARLLGAVLVFRFVYFLVPLAIGGLVFAASELTFRARDARKGTD